MSSLWLDMQPSGGKGNTVARAAGDLRHKDLRISLIRAFRVLILLLVSVVAHSTLAQEGGRLERVASESASTSALEPGKKLALVIGNSAYRSLLPLANPRNDAEDVCAAVKSIGFEATCVFDVATRRELSEVIRLFAAAAAAGTETFFFYAGHGIQSKGENYLIPTDAQIWSEADIDFEGVALGYLMSSLDQARSYPNLIILDACRDNAFREAARFRVERGLARVEPPIGTVIAYATSPNKAALDGTGRNGLFTKHLLNRLSAPGLQLDEMLRQVSKGVEDEARSVYHFEQVPYRSSSYSASYCLAGCEDPGLAAKLAGIEEQKNELNRRLEQISAENTRLRAQAQWGADEIERLERKISRLANQERVANGKQEEDAARELREARAALAAMKADQTQRDAREKESQRRISELESLRAELQKQSIEIDEYRKRIRDLETARSRSLKSDEGRARPRESPRNPGLIVPSF